MEQVRSKRTAGRFRAELLMIRGRWLAVIVATVVVSIAGAGGALAQATTSGNVDSMMARAVKLRQNNRKTEALAEMQRAASVDPGRADVLTFRDLLLHEVHGSEATLGGEYHDWDDARGPRREPQLSFRKNTLRGPMIARASRIAQSGLADDKLEVEAYPSFPGGYGSLAVGYASKATLYARSTMSVELYKTFPDKFEGSLGYRRMNFANPVNVYTGSIGNYYGNYLLGARVSHVRAGAAGTVASLSMRRYYGDEGEYIGAQATSGSIRENIRTTADVDALSSHSIGVEGLFIVRSRWMLTARQAIGRDERPDGGSATLLSLNCGVGMRF